MVLFGSLVLSAAAQPQIPATYFGTATNNGANVPDGTAVRAFVGGVDCTQSGSAGTLTDGGVSSYIIVVMHESQAEGCGSSGAMVSFTIGGAPANQTAEWIAGVANLNLNLGEGTAIALPSATPLPTLSASEATASAIPTSRAEGPPPTDDSNVPRPTIGDPAIVEDGRQSSSLLGWLVIILGGLALGGAAAGWLLSRKRG